MPDRICTDPLCPYWREAWRQGITCAEQMARQQSRLAAWADQLLAEAHRQELRRELGQVRIARALITQTAKLVREQAKEQ